MKCFSFFACAFVLMRVSAGAQEINTVSDFGYALKLYDQKLYRIAIDSFRDFQFNNPGDPRNAEAQYYTGSAYMALGEYDRAKDAFSEFTARYRTSPLNPDAWKRLAECYEALGDMERAAQTFEAMADILFADTRFSVPAMYRAGELYLKRGNREKGFLLLNRIIDTHPRHEIFPKAVTTLARAYAGTGNYIAAMRVLTKLEESGAAPSSKEEATYLRGVYALAINNNAEGETALSNVLSGTAPDDPIHQEASLALAAHYQEQGRHGEAQGILDRLTNAGAISDLNRGKALAISGISHYIQENFPEARTALDRALELLEPSSDSYRKCLYYLGMVYLKTGDATGAFSHLKRLFSGDWLTTFDAEEPPPYEMDGFRRFMETARLVNAPVDISLYRDALLKRSEGFRDAFSFLRWGNLFSESSLFATAGALYASGYEKFPNERYSDYLLEKQAETQELLSEYGRASALYRTVIKDFPGGEAARRAVQRIDYIDLKYSSLSPDEILQKKLKLSDILLAGIEEGGSREQNDETIFSRGVLQYELRKYEEALASFRRLIDNGSSGEYYADALRYSALIHDNLYSIFSFEGNPESARLSAQAARDFYAAYGSLSAGGEFSGTARNRNVALSLALMQKTADKIAYVRSLLSEADEAADTGFKRYAGVTLAELLVVSGDSSSMLEEAVKLLEHPGQDPGGTSSEKEMSLMVSAAVRLGDESLAIRASTSYLNVFPRGVRAPEVRFRGAKALLATGDTTTAQMWIRQLEKDFYYSSYVDSAAILQADIAAGGGDTETALTIYRTLLDKTSAAENPRIVSEMLRKMGDAYTASEDFVSAADYYRRYIASTGSSDARIRGYMSLAKVNYARGDLNGALNAYRAIAGMDADSSARLKARIEEAYLLSERADNPASPDYDEHLREARDAFTALARESVPDSTRARFEFSAIATLYRLDRRTQANSERTRFERRIRNLSAHLRDEFTGLLRVEEGEVFQRAGIRFLTTANQREAEKQFREAESIFTDVIRSYPGGKGRQLAEFFLGLQRVAFQNNFDDGMPLLMNFRTKYPGSPYLFQVYSQLGNLFFQLEDYKNAFLYYDIALNTPRGERDAALHQRYIEACERAGFPIAQIEAITAYLKHFPNAPDRMSKRIKVGNLYREVGQFGNAAAQFRSLLPHADPAEQIEIQYYLAESFYVQKKYARAIAEYLKILQYGDPSAIDVPFHTNARWYVALSFEELGDYQSALTYLDKIISSHPPGDLFYKRALQEKNQVVQLMKIRK